MEDFNPDIWTLFKTKVQSNIEGMKDFLDVYDKDTFIELDICSSTEETSLDNDSIDLVVTSPPYGDSKTTVAYGQFSRLSLQWMGYDEANKIDKQCMGGVPVNDLVCDISSPTLEAIVAEISQIDSRRGRDVLSFNYDLSLCIKELARVVRKGGFVCMVIGNRTVKGVQIPTDQIIVEIAQDYDFYHQQTIIRNIPNKRMPSKNSPTNVRGEKGTTMLKEGIVVLKKS
jgi:DNA modification methylase